MTQCHTSLKTNNQSNVAFKEFQNFHQIYNGDWIINKSYLALEGWHMWAHRPGIRCQAVFVTQHWVSTCLGISFFCKVFTIYSAH